MTLLENKMYKAPVFFHKNTGNDFLCVIHKEKRESYSVYI